MSLARSLINSYSAIVYTYKTIGTEKLASHYLGWEEVKELAKYYRGEMALLQTCNRIEIYLFSKNSASSQEILRYLNQVHGKEISSDAITLVGEDAIKHLFEVASGIDSLSVGEYEILSQIKNSLKDSIRLGIGSKHMRALMERALKVGRRVRLETSISKGKVGVHSLAVEFTKTIVKDLSSRKIAIVGAGEIASKLALILHNEGARNVTIFNRTFERGRDLAVKYGFSYFPLDFNRLHNYDVIFSAIFYPEKIKNISNSVIVDLGSPPVFEGANVYTLKDLEVLSKARLEERQREIQKAKEIIKEGIKDFEKDCLNLIYDEFVAEFMNKIEEIRREEVERAVKMLGGDSKTREILDAMSRSMNKKTFSPLFENLKRATERGEINYINLVTSLFTHEGISQSKTKEIKTEQEYKGHDS
ncbi:glutamyl-tRNA reductase [Metallosphaera tengchongensis]|uniref:Glutamyl-tRNA reductase n=1 Tax=Metallosphaera tengchongensis TaxID=1532350 RepID=A0A6N0NWF3_9CREN|nr:glutamyl-tRNA reductase [Metallosphaera tengchongensis]QKQ99968.1 glutamyl-tRNA reductase [Metallosphaera tengchongensis]